MNEYFTITGLVSFAGALFFSLVIPNVLLSLIGDSFRPHARVVALVVALLLTLFGAFLSEGDYTRFVVAIFNGILVYGSAYGINAQVVEATTPQSDRGLESFMRSEKPAKFFKDW